jgi:ribosomal protein L31E
MSDLKNRIRIGNSVNSKLWNGIRALSEETRIPISKLLDEALELLLKKHGK